MSRVLQAFFGDLFETGSIEIETATGDRITLGDGSGEKLGLRFKDRSALFRLMADPEFQFGQLYMDGLLEVTKGTLFDVLMLVSANLWRPGGSRWLRFVKRARGFLGALRRPNGLLRARRNVAHHYDFDAAFYRKFLDTGLQYSCAYFERDGQSLESAQLAKKRHIAAKLLIDPGQSVLDIGCGFGGMALYLARFCGASVTGVTLSQTQLGVARSAAADLGLTGATNFRFCDYRELDERFDRIVSVGMFEHVGLARYDLFFRKVAQLLDDDGVALLHTIGRADGPWPTNPWVAKYIFPGGYMPALSEIMPAVERCGLFVTDIEILRLHYAETLKAWRARLEAHRAEIEAKRGARFWRMWELYLAGSECAFRRQGFIVFQIQLAKKLETVPLKRDYIGRAEAALRQRDSAAANLRLAGE